MTKKESPSRKKSSHMFILYFIFMKVAMLVYLLCSQVKSQNPALLHVPIPKLRRVQLSVCSADVGRLAFACWFTLLLDIWLAIKSPWLANSQPQKNHIHIHQPQLTIAYYPPILLVNCWHQPCLGMKTCACHALGGSRCCEVAGCRRFARQGHCLGFGMGFWLGYSHKPLPSSGI